MKKLAKILVLVLSVALVFGAVAMAVSAEGGACKIGDVVYDDFATALAAAQAEETITLTADLEVSSPIALPAGVTLDLGGHKVTNTADTAVFELGEGSVISGQGNIVTKGAVITASSDASILGSGFGIHIDTDASTLFEVSGALLINLVEVSSSNVDFTEIASGATSVTATNFVFDSIGGIAFRSEAGIVSLTNSAVVGVDSFFVGEETSGAQFVLNKCAIEATSYVFNAKVANYVEIANCDIALTGDAETAISIFGGVSATVNGGKVAAGKGTDCTNGATVTYGDGVYLDFATTSIADGLKLNYDPMTNPGYYYIVSTAAPSIPVYFQNFDAASNISGLVHAVGFRSFVDIDGNGDRAYEYHLPRYTFDEASGTYVSEDPTVAYNGDAIRTQAIYNPDNKTVEITASQQCYSDVEFTQVGTGYGGSTKDFRVIAYEFKVATSGEGDNAPSFTLHFTGRPTTGSTTKITGAITIGNNFKVNGSNKVIEGKAKDEYTTVTFVIDSETAKAHAFIDGEYISMTTAFNSGWKSLTGFRCYLNKGVYDENATIRFNDFEKRVYTEYIGDEFNAADYVGGAKPELNYAASVNGMKYNSFAEAADAAIEAGSFVKLNSNTVITDDQTIHPLYVYSNGFEISIPEYRIGKTEVNNVNGEFMGYIVDLPLFTITHSDKTVTKYYTVADFMDVMTHFVTDSTVADVPLNLLSILKDGDAIKLNGDIVYTGKAEGRLGKLTVSLDLNGFTINTSNSSAIFCQLGGSSYGTGNGNHNNDAFVGLTVKSSRLGGKIYTSGDYALFKLTGNDKTLIIEGGSKDNPSVIIQAKKFIQMTSAGSATAGDSQVTVNGGELIQNATASHFVEIYNVSGKNYYGKATFNGSKIISYATPDDSYIFKTTLKGTTSCNSTRTLTITGGCEIETARADKAIFSTNIANLNFYIGNSSFFGDITPAGAVAPVILDSDVVYTTCSDVSTVSIGDRVAMKYNYVAESEAQQYILSAAENAKNVKYLDENGTELVSYENYYMETVLPVSDYKAADVEGVAIKLVHNGFEEAEESTVNAQVYAPRFEAALKVEGILTSTTLYTELGVNLYLPVAYKDYVSGVEFAELDAEDEDYGEYVVAKATVPVNLAFSGVDFGLIFTETLGGEEYSLALNKNVSIFAYATTVLKSDDAKITAAEKDLMYYMINYFGAAYAYEGLGLSEKEIATLTSLVSGLDATDANARLVAKAYVNAALNGYTATEYEAIEEAFEGGLGLIIYVDLQASPIYVIKLNGASYVKVNGALLVANEKGEYIYELEDVHSFDQSLRITTDLGAANFSLANYYAAALANSDSSAPVVEALYQYVLAARAYKLSLTASAE